MKTVTTFSPRGLPPQSFLKDQDVWNHIPRNENDGSAHPIEVKNECNRRDSNPGGKLGRLES